MVRAENDLFAILTALKDGAFYSSCGPVIHNFYVEDNKAVVECSPAVKVRFHSDMHPTHVIRSEDGGAVTRAELDLNGVFKYAYVRAVVIDENGKYAWTNPIFLN